MPHCAGGVGQSRVAPWDGGLGVRGSRVAPKPALVLKDAPAKRGKYVQSTLMFS